MESKELATPVTSRSAAVLQYSMSVVCICIGHAEIDHRQRSCCLPCVSFTPPSWTVRSHRDCSDRTLRLIPGVAPASTMPRGLPTAQVFAIGAVVWLNSHQQQPRGLRRRVHRRLILFIAGIAFCSWRLESRKMADIYFRAPYPTITRNKQHDKYNDAPRSRCCCGYIIRINEQQYPDSHQQAPQSYRE